MEKFAGRFFTFTLGCGASVLPDVCACVCVFGAKAIQHVHIYALTFKFLQHSCVCRCMYITCTAITGV